MCRAKLRTWMAPVIPEPGLFPQPWLRRGTARGTVHHSNTNKKTRGPSGPRAAGVTAENTSPPTGLPPLVSRPLGGKRLPSYHGAPFREELVAEAALKIECSVKRSHLKDPLSSPEQRRLAIRPLWR